MRGEETENCRISNQDFRMSKDRGEERENGTHPGLAATPPEEGIRNKE